MVGVAGFELATYWSQTSCATRLRYTPNRTRLYSGGRGRRARSGQQKLTRNRGALLNVLFADELER
jgi:hypothetical protein